jgi:YbbR domain-containing protein
MKKWKTPKVKNLLLNDIELKIFSLFLAVIIWYFIIGQEVKETILYVPIEYKNLPSSLQMMGEARNVLEVTIKGPAAFLKRLTPQDIRITLDLSDAQKGSRTYYQKDFIIDVPFGVSVTKIYPQAIKIDFGTIVRKGVRIKLNVVGECPYGYRLKSYKIEPNEVLVEGVEETVNKLKYISTDTVDISNLTANKDLVVSLSGEIEGISILQPTSVKVHLNVEEIITEKIIKKLKLEIGDKRKVITYSASNVDIVLQGPVRLLENINLELFRPYLETAGLATGVYTLPVKINYPDDFKSYIKIISIEPDKITVRIK